MLECKEEKYFYFILFCFLWEIKSQPQKYRNKTTGVQKPKYQIFKMLNKIKPVEFSNSIYISTLVIA